jgi:pyrroloquinoline quinone biosynthesis protein D
VTDQGEGVIPTFRRGVKFRFDETRQAWILLAPEKLFTPEGTAVEILKRVDGARTVAEIVNDLAETYKAPRDLIARDAIAMLRDLEAKGVLSL